MRIVQKEAIEFVHGKKPERKDDPLVQYALLDSIANVLCPACKLWNTGHGARMMREAVSLMGGYGITEEFPVGQFFKRLLVIDAMFGRAPYHLARYARRIVAESCGGS